MSAVFDFSAALNDVAPVSSIRFTVKLYKKRFARYSCEILVLLPLQLRSSRVSVLFISVNNSPNDFAPSFSIRFTICIKYEQKEVISYRPLHVCFLYLLLRLSPASVVLSFNASHNDVTPSFPMLFPVD